MAHPGIANDFNDKDARKYYTYYQWVCFVLFFQVSQRNEGEKEDEEEEEKEKNMGKIIVVEREGRAELERA